MIADEYDRKARVYPALLAALPLSMTGVVFGITSAKWWATLASLAVASGFWFVAAQIGRHPGKQLESDLWTSWGGAPTTIPLRHRDNPNPVRVNRLHERLRIITGSALPSADEESADPEAADATYEAAVTELREVTRNHDRYPLVFKENINYGFRRNTFGLKGWGIAACIIAVIATALAMITDEPDVLDVDVGLGVTLIVLDLLTASAWWKLVTPEWVKQPAFAYAERLLEATRDLVPR